MRLIHPEAPGCVVETDNPQQYVTQGWIEVPPELAEADVPEVTIDDQSSSSSASEPTNEIAAWAARREESPWP